VDHNVTLFTCPRVFEGEIGIIQANAVESWRRLKPAPEILFISPERQGVEEAAQKYGCRYIPGRSNEHGTPLVADIFTKGQREASHPVRGYINCDIVLTQPFMGAVRRVVKAFDKFLVIGQRTDFYYPHPIDFSEKNWGARFTKRARKKGKLHGPTGIDYFIYGGWEYPQIPDFYLGCRAWDNWLVWYALRQPDIDVMDVTKVVRAVHIGKTTTKPITSEIEHNRHLAGQAGTWGRVNFAHWALQPEHDYPGELFR
jgi:hypothetical protein